MKVTRRQVSVTSVLVAFLLPLVAGAATNSTDTFKFQDPLSQTPIVCALKGFLGGIYLVGTPVAVLALAYAGFLLVAARGNPKALSDARSRLLRVLLGVLLFLGSWLLGVALVNTANTVFPGLVTGIASCN